MQAVLRSNNVNVELIIVDNGSSSIAKLPTDGRMTVVSNGFNTGFAGGCNFGVCETSSSLLVFVNSDLIVDPDAIYLLTERLKEEEVGLVTGAVLLPGLPTKVNSVGNPIRFLMFSWAGAYGEGFEKYQNARDVAGISGALFACTRAHWQRLGGFDKEYFAYAEDADISLRTWQAGLRVVFEPLAKGVHHYEFGRSSEKWFWLERNRKICFLTLYSTYITLLLLPVFTIVEFGVFYSSVRGGWWRQKLRAWHWIVTNKRYLLERRQRIHREHTQDKLWLDVLSSTIDIPDEFGLHVPLLVNSVLKSYWELVRKIVVFITAKKFRSSIATLVKVQN